MRKNIPTTIDSSSGQEESPIENSSSKTKSEFIIKNVKDYESNNYAIAPLLAGGLIAAGGSLLGGLFSSSGQKSANDTNMQIAQAQNQWNIEQWNRENEYNTPAAQVQRLKDAGLNPNLIYGNSSAGAVSASSPRASGATVSNAQAGHAAGISAATQQLMNIVMQQAEYNKMNAQSDLARNQADLARVNASLSEANVLKTQSQTGYYDTSSQLNVSRSSLIEHQISNIDAQTLATEARTEGQNIYNRFAQRLHESNISLRQATQALNERQTQAISEKISQAWRSLDISEGRYQNDSSRTFWSTHMIEAAIDKLKAGTTGEEMRNEMLRENLDYKHINAFFDALDKATRWIPFNN